ncbi:MAG: hypothetical protein ACLQPD_35255 [Desulfomonilaceae bacterium]
MNYALRPLKKGGYSHQPQIVRFRASIALHEALRRLAEKEGLCVAAVVRGLVLAGLQKIDNCQTKPEAGRRL